MRYIFIKWRSEKEVENFWFWLTSLHQIVSHNIHTFSSSCVNCECVCVAPPNILSFSYSFSSFGSFQVDVV